MLKRLFGILLILSIMLSCCLVFSACRAHADNGTITESNWTAALNPWNETKISVTYTTCDYVTELRCDGTNFSITKKSEGSEVSDSESIWIKSEDKYAVYELGRDGRYTKTEETSDQYLRELSIAKKRSCD